MIDDDVDVRTIAQAALVSLGYTALEIGDPQKAIRIARAQPIHLLLADLVMPLMKGTELADRIQAVNPSTKVLLMSGYQTSEIAPSGRAFLGKPFSIAQLAKAVRETLDRPSAFARPRPPAATHWGSQAGRRSMRVASATSAAMPSMRRRS
ncbi:MAG: response regulator [Candidatus Rokuibacteriota bacterium]